MSVHRVPSSCWAVKHAVDLHNERQDTISHEYDKQTRHGTYANFQRAWKAKMDTV
jgi:hypothetical protein